MCTYIVMYAYIRRMESTANKKSFNNNKCTAEREREKERVTEKERERKKKTLSTSH